MSDTKKIGTQSIRFSNPPVIEGWASVAGKKESQGPLGKYFDVASDTDMFSAKNWEEAESKMQMSAVRAAISKAGIKKEDVDYIVAGDLLGQLMATSFGIKSLDIPLFGVYGACSTMGESSALASMLIDGGYAKRCIALTSSHFATAEKQFRFPLGYGSQRPLCATTTVTGSGALVLCSQKTLKEEKTDYVNITGITTGKIVDFGIKDSNNMGAAMAPAAYDLIKVHAKDFETDFNDYDKVITGDLGVIGRDILLDMLRAENIDIADKYMDCGIEIYDSGTQDSHSGGSGCGCSAITLCGLIMHNLINGIWKKVLFVPTGALMSSVSFHEGNTVPGIAHGIILQSGK